MLATVIETGTLLRDKFNFILTMGENEFDTLSFIPSKEECSHVEPKIF
jgi:hypothetical protein